MDLYQERADREGITRREAKQRTIIESYCDHRDEKVSYYTLGGFRQARLTCRGCGRVRDLRVSS